MIENAVDFLLPSWWEVKVSVATTLFVVAAYWFFTSHIGKMDDDRSLVDNPGAARDLLDDIDKVNSGNFIFLVLFLFLLRSTMVNSFSTPCFDFISYEYVDLLFF